MNLLTKQKQTHRYKKQTYGYQRGKWGEGRDKLGFTLGLTYTLLYRKETTNKDLLYSTWNYMQYFLIAYKGK